MRASMTLKVHWRKKMQDSVDTSQITAGQINVADIDAGHIAIGTWNGKTGADSKFGVKHLYSDRYRELWPQEHYPELYKEDVDCGE